MSDLIKRLRHYAKEICGGEEQKQVEKDLNEAADALENPAHAWLMVAAKACAGMMNNPAIEIYGEPNAQDCATMLEKLAAEYPPAVCVPVEPQGETPQRTCVWKPADVVSMPDTWEGDCEAVWTFIEGGPAKNNMHYCPKCGGLVVVAAIDAEIDK